MPSARTTSRSARRTKSRRLVPADSAVWLQLATRSNSARLICERPALWRQTNRTVAILSSRGWDDDRGGVGRGDVGVENAEGERGEEAAGELGKDEGGNGGGCD